MSKIEKVSAEGHEGDAICVVYYDNQVFSGGADGKIKIWDNDLNLIRTVNAHEAYIYALAINSGKLYSSSCDGCVKFMQAPYDSLEELFRCEDAIQSMYCDGDMLYTGDDKGVVTTWQNDKMLFKYNLVEEVKSMAAENLLVYTVRDLDVVVSQLQQGKSGRYSNKAVMPGKSPLCFVGPLVEGRRTFLAYADRTGKGLTLVRNLPDLKFAPVWNLLDCHEMIVNGICGNEQYLYSGGYDGKVKGWSNLDQAQPQPRGTVDVGSCVNSICCGSGDNVYIAASDGLIRRAKFSSI